MRKKIVIGGYEFVETREELDHEYQMIVSDGTGEGSTKRILNSEGDASELEELYGIYVIVNDNLYSCPDLGDQLFALCYVQNDVGRTYVVPVRNLAESMGSVIAGRELAEYKKNKYKATLKKKLTSPTPSNEK